MYDHCIDENLIGYLLGALDDETSAQVAVELRGDADARRRLEELRAALEPLALDSKAPTPPPGLAVRTMARVAEHCCHDLAKAPALLARPMPPRSWWRRADFVVAASLLIIGLGIGVPALLKLTQSSVMAQCANNTRKMGTAFHDYHELYGKFPSVKDEQPRDAAGMVIPILTSAGVLPEGCNVRCPGSTAEVGICPMTREQAWAFSDEEFLRQMDTLNPTYAYSLGFYDENNDYRGPIVPLGVLASEFPLMADAPPEAGNLGNSPNHAGKGQRILFADGHSAFFTVRKIGAVKDDIYCNKKGEVAAGVDSKDVVLGPSGAKP